MRAEITHIVRVKCQWVGSPLRPTPERLTCTSDSVLRQAVEQLTDLIVEVPLELRTGPDNALLESQGFVGYKVRNNLLDLFLLLAGELQSCLKVVRLRKVCVDRFNRLDEEAVKLAATPLRNRQ